MKTYPKKYTKEEFLAFLEKNNVNDNIISKFAQLPEIIKHSGSTFDLDITSIWYAKDETYYTFELNYYSEELIEYLFNSKVFTDIGLSINYLMCELNDKNFIKIAGECKS